MSFIKVPSVIYIPDDDALRAQYRVFYKGIGGDDLYVYLWGGTYHMSTECAPAVIINGGTLQPTYNTVNGYIYWQNDDKILYFNSFNAQNQWVYGSRDTVYPGAIPYSRYLESGTLYDPTPRYEGDFYYTASDRIDTSTNPLDAVLTGLTSSWFYPHGTALNQASHPAIKAQYVFTGWLSSSLCGEYTPITDGQQTKVFGLPQWIDSSEETYTRSLNREYNGEYTYGRIKYYTTYNPYRHVWATDNPDESVFWWEGPEPSLDSSVMYVLCSHDSTGLEIVYTSSSSEISFDKYVIGENTTPIYLGEVAVWR